MRVLQAILTVTLLGAWGAASAQNGGTIGAPPNVPYSGPQAPQAQRPPFGAQQPEGNPISPEVQQRLEIARQNDRQQKMVADTAHLLALATELKADMDKTTKDTLSVEVVKKADEIEKLAHDIKKRMTN